MRLCDMDPYVRFAASVRNGIMNTAVKVTDCRIFYVEDGQADIHIGDKCLHLNKNSLFYCCGGSAYRVQTQAALSLICINFDLTRSNAEYNQPFRVCSDPQQWPDMRIHYESVEDSSFLGSYLLLEDGTWLCENIAQIVAEYREHTHLSDMLCGSLLKSLLLKMHQAKGQQIPTKLATVQAYIQSHFDEPLTNSQLGQLVGYHEYYLNRVFSTYTGMNLHKYLLKVRMEKAAYLILNTDMPLNSIAEAVGLHSYPHFSSCFRNSWGCSPAQYRQRHRAGI